MSCEHGGEALMVTAIACAILLAVPLAFLALWRTTARDQARNQRRFVARLDDVASALAAKIDALRTDHERDASLAVSLLSRKIDEAKAPHLRRPPKVDVIAAPAASSLPAPASIPELGAPEDDEAETQVYSRTTIV
jgi:hypothetical protein